ncbi:unnamed protein product [Paramecium pentaurelia]|uniref:Transmembrane protein n=1 Tax=Paramecium pentaurelia TaxID=43138 RepID=A0A8S1V5F6_9CILI|nr:unnamed protein product [Paramecium pentaurelia]
MFIILSVLTQLSYGCSVWANDTFYITATPGEKVDIKLDEIFRDKNIQQYTISPTSELYQLSNPLSLIQQSQYNQIEPRELIASKLYKSSGYLDITNQITILSKAQNKYFIEYSSLMFENTPDIDIVQQVNVKVDSICYDTVQVDLLYIIECNNVDGDYFAILNKDQVQYMTIINSQRQQRKLDQLDKFILRNLYYSLELYQLQDNQLVLISTLNTELLRQLTKDDKFDLLIVDFKFHTNQQITILNQKGQFICLKYMNQQNQWELYEYLQTQTNLPYAYDYSWKYLQLVIISDKIIYLRQISTWTQKDNLNFDPNNKVQLLQNYIIIQKLNSLQILNFNFKEIQSIDIQTQGFLNSYPAFDSFLFFDYQNFYAYTINQENQQILRFQSNQLINEYQLFKIQKQTPYKLCEIKCYYKVVDIATKDIYQQVQVSNSFFKGGLLLDEQQSLQFTQPFVGQNLKLEFTPNQFMTVQFSRSKKVEILYSGDPKDIIYRKIIPEIGQTSFIEQNNDLQITGYLCNLIEQQFQCKTFIQTHDFIKLQDSPLQTWFAQFYTYLAIGKDKNVDLYCNCNDQIQISLLTTLVMDGNIKEIKHSFSYLLILVDQELLVYQINNSKQRLVFRHLAEKVYTSANLDQVWIYSKKTLYLFDISDNTKLLWFTYLKDYDDIEVGVSQNQFLLLAKRDNLYQGFVYDYQNLKYAYILKQLDLSGYTELKLCLSCNSNSKFIYLEAQKNGNHVLLIYRLDQIAINSLFIEFTILANSQITSNEQNLFITNSQMLSQYIIQNQDSSSISIEIDQNYQQVKNCEIIKLNGKVSNSDKNQEIKDIPISLINRGINIFGIENELNFNYEKDGNNSHCFDLGQSWYSGQAFEIDLQQQGNGDIKLQKTLIKQEQSIEYSQSIMEYDNNTLIQLISNKIIFISKQDFQIIEYQLDNQYQFINILYIQSNLIYLQAIFNKQYFIKLLQFKDSQIILQNGQITYNYYIKKAFLNQDRFFTWIYNYAIAYDTKNDPTNLNEFEVIQRVFPSFYPVSLEFKHVKDQIYYFFFISQSAQLEIAAYEIVKNSQKNFFLDYHTADNLKLQGMFFPLDYTCSGMVMTENQVVISLNNSISYAFNYQIACQDNYLCQITQFSYKNSYQQYGSWSLKNEYPSLFVSENILSIIYQSEKDHELLLYDLNDNSNKTGPISAIAYLKSKNLEDQKIVQSFVYNYKEQLHLLSSAEDKQKLQHYIIRRSPQICIEKQSISQNVNISLKNQNQEKLVNLKLNIDQIKSDSSHFKIWIILVIVLVIVIVGISVIIYCQKKRRRLVKQNLLIED